MSASLSRISIALLGASIVLGGCGGVGDTVPANATVLVTVTDAHGTPVNDAEVTVNASSATGSVSYTKPADTRGRVTFTDVKAGRHLELDVTVRTLDVNQAPPVATQP